MCLCSNHFILLVFASNKCYIYKDLLNIQRFKIGYKNSQNDIKNLNSFIAMVFIQDGSSRMKYNRTLLREKSVDVTKCLQQSEIPDFLYMYAPCSELPSNISTMFLTVFL